ncbi:MAG: hypothetical protein SFX18_00510 [Pirellulales bacterium]|nr:hypothetical protein [Pirellulales bacterium]
MPPEIADALAAVLLDISEKLDREEKPAPAELPDLDEQTKAAA